MNEGILYISWFALKNDQCPSCGCNMLPINEALMHECGGRGCDFKINEEAFNKARLYYSSLVQKEELEDPDHRLELLNSL